MSAIDLVLKREQSSRREKALRRSMVLWGNLMDRPPCRCVAGKPCDSAPALGRARRDAAPSSAEIIYQWQYEIERRYFLDEGGNNNGIVRFSLAMERIGCKSQVKE
jgi:hypothetical protein